MESNPYESPQTTSDVMPEGGTVQYRVFRAQSFAFRLTAGTLYDEIRRAAQHAIDAEFGAENVISIIENIAPLGGFSVVVWYRVSPKQT